MRFFGTEGKTVSELREMVECGKAGEGVEEREKQRVD